MFLSLLLVVVVNHNHFTFIKLLQHYNQGIIHPLVMHNYTNQHTTTTHNQTHWNTQVWTNDHDLMSIIAHIHIFNRNHTLYHHRIASHQTLIIIIKYSCYITTLYVYGYIYLLSGKTYQINHSQNIIKWKTGIT